MKNLLPLLVYILVISISANSNEISMRNSTDTCDASSYGAIRYTSGTDSFEGCTASGWTSLTKGGETRKLLHVRDEKPNGTQGGSRLSGAWYARDLNTVLTNQISGSSLSSNAVTLPAGTYEFLARQPFYATTGVIPRIKSSSGAAVEVIGHHSYSATGTGMDITFGGQFTVSSTTTIKLEYLSYDTKSTYGLGSISVIAGYNEVYSDLMIWKIE